MDGSAVATKAKGFSLRLLLVIVIFLFSLAVFAFIADEMVLENENAIDSLVFQKIDHFATPGVTKLMVFITFFGSNYFLLPAYILLVTYFLLFKKTRRLSLDVAAIGITSTALLFSLKFLFRRPRPLNALVNKVNGFSFPSGHSFCSFTFFGLLIYIIWKSSIKPTTKWFLSFLFFVFACMVALSRVYLHVHYASDVAAGFFLCVVWLGISFWVINRFHPHLS
jgi:undecaprenyl-diphosphatase